MPERDKWIYGKNASKSTGLYRDLAASKPGKGSQSSAHDWPWYKEAKKKYGKNLAFNKSEAMISTADSLISDIQDLLERSPRSKPIIMYHGTSSKNLRSILKQGLIPDPKSRVWQDDPDAAQSYMTVTRKSLSGSYLTDNIGTATSAALTAAQKSKGEQLVVVASVQPRSGFADEDDIVYEARRAIKKAMFPPGVIGDEETWPVVWIGYTADPSEATKAIKKFAVEFKKALSVEHPSVSKIPLDRKAVEDMFWGLLEQAVSKWYAYNKKMPYSAENYYYSAVKRLNLTRDQERKYYALMLTRLKRLSLQKAEKRYLDAADKLTRQLKQLAVPKEGAFRTNVRFEVPINYKGQNKILAIFEMRYGEDENGKTETHVKVHYGKIPSKAAADLKQKQGSFKIVDSFQKKSWWAESVCESTLLERTLYHGTLKDYKKSILDVGLVPSEGEFVNQMYGSYSSQGGGAIFAADRKGLDNAVGAIRFHIAQKLGGQAKGVYLTDIGIPEIKEHGMLAVMKEVELGDLYDDPEEWRRHPGRDKLNYDVPEMPASVEPGDYFLTNDQGVGVDFVLTGNKLVQFLRRHGGLKHVVADQRRELIKLMVQHKGSDAAKKQSIVKLVKSIKDQDLRQALRAERQKTESTDEQAQRSQRNYDDTRFFDNSRSNSNRYYDYQSSIGECNGQHNQDHPGDTAVSVRNGVNDMDVHELIECVVNGEDPAELIEKVSYAYDIRHDQNIETAPIRKSYSTGKFYPFTYSESVDEAKKRLPKAARDLLRSSAHAYPPQIKFISKAQQKYVDEFIKRGWVTKTDPGTYNEGLRITKQGTAALHKDEW